MRIVILTTVPHGLASLCLPALVASPKLEMAGVILAHGITERRWRHRWRKMRKIARIGPLGALIGYRMRSWHRDDGAAVEHVAAVCRRLGVRLLESGPVNSPHTVGLMRGLEPDLGLSLGNPYIGRAVYSVPHHGMVNYHGEILPDYQGGASVIWAIHDGKRETGFTLHRIDDALDTGAILYQERHPILLRATLRETVQASERQYQHRIAPALVRVCEDWEAFAARAEPQPRGRTYTTPTLWEFIRMVRMHRRMLREGRQTGRAPSTT